MKWRRHEPQNSIPPRSAPRIPRPPRPARPDFLGTDGLGDVFRDLDISVPSDYAQQYFISAKNYSLFFRVLYNATYLSREMSEKALGLLSKTVFRDGLTAKLPSSVVVSHKFGEWVLLSRPRLRRGLAAVLAVRPVRINL